MATRSSKSKFTPEVNARNELKKAFSVSDTQDNVVLGGQGVVVLHSYQFILS